MLAFRDSYTRVPMGLYCCFKPEILSFKATFSCSAFNSVPSSLRVVGGIGVVIAGLSVVKVHDGGVHTSIEWSPVNP